MKTLKKILLISFLSFTGVVLAQQRANQPVRRPLPPAKPGTQARPAAQPNATDPELAQALSLAKKGDYDAASIRLFNMTRNPKFEPQRMRIKYILGLMLYEMKMHQVAAFQFVDVVRNSDARYLKQSLQKISIIADVLNDDTLLNYAISRVNIDDFPKEYHDMLNFRFGEFYARKQDWTKAIASFSHVPPGSPFFTRARYMEGLANAQTNNLAAALRAFNALVEAKEEAGVTNIDRVAGIMGMARTYYQAKRWDLAVDMYRQIPRDTELWHDTLFESSWAHMRAAQFRSVLSNLHSLHSAYYEDFYLPESILLRGIVYLYICQYDEMEKTLALFERLYQPVLTGLEQFTAQNEDPLIYYNEIEKTIRNFQILKGDTSARKSYRIPFIVARSIIKEGDFKHVYTYLTKLRAEDANILKMPVTWRRSPLGIYARQLLKGRIDTSKKLAGSIVRAHMLTMKQDLSDNFEQYNFAKYEMLNGKKEALKKKIQGKGLLTQQVDESKSRDFYIQNGYEYWPFRGEYWLDEIGNYHYLGTQGCE